MIVRNKGLDIFEVRRLSCPLLKICRKLVTDWWERQIPQFLPGVFLREARHVVDAVVPGVGGGHDLEMFDVVVFRS